jgi:hypothetical protein
MKAIHSIQQQQQQQEQQYKQRKGKATRHFETFLNS